MVGSKIRGLYEGSGWNTGTIKYYNSKLDKYLLGFDDLIREEDIDGVELFFVDKPKRPLFICNHLFYGFYFGGSESIGCLAKIELAPRNLLYFVNSPTAMSTKIGHYSRKRNI